MIQAISPISFGNAVTTGAQAVAEGAKEPVIPDAKPDTVEIKKAVGEVADDAVDATKKAVGEVADDSGKKVINKKNLWQAIKNHPLKTVLVLLAVVAGAFMATRKDEATVEDAA